MSVYRSLRFPTRALFTSPIPSVEVGTGVRGDAEFRPTFSPDLQTASDEYRVDRLSRHGKVERRAGACATAGVDVYRRRRRDRAPRGPHHRRDFLPAG